MNGGAPSGTCLVAGGTGFLGRAVVEALSRAGWSVVTASRGAAGLSPGIPHRSVDLAAASWPADLLAGVDAVVNLVAALPGDPPERFRLVNVDAASRLAGLARQAGVARLVHLSSTRAVVGAGVRWVRDGDRPEPVDAYGRSKDEGERAVSAAFGDAVILRPPLILGDGMKGSMARFVALSRSGWPLPFAGLVEPRSYVTAADLADAIRHALQLAPSGGLTALVASEPDLAIATLAASIRAGQRRPPRLFRVPDRLLAAAVAALAGPDAAAALVAPLRVEASRLKATGWLPTDDVIALARRLGAAAQDGSIAT